MRVRQAVRLARQEWHGLRDASAVNGGRASLVERARVLLGLEQLEARDAQGRHQLEARVATRLDQLDSRAQRRLQTEAQAIRTALVDAHHELRSGLDELEGRAQALRDQTESTRRALIGTQELLEAGLGMVDRRHREQSLHGLVEPVTAWIRQTTPEETPLISVVLATRNRSALLRRAVGSVQAQAYRHWELIAVDDGSTDGTGELLAELAGEDSRIVVVSESRRGVGAARNAGLSAARGEFVCYLDDDNIMQPLWLKAVAWAVGRQPGIELLYGARIADVDHPEQGRPGGMPFLHFETFDRARLEVGNFIDLGVIAHRRNLPEAIFDETLEALSDWDLLLRMTVARTPTALPVVASLYTTTAPDRISSAGASSASELVVLSKLLRDRPLRVLAYNALFPLVPETYIADEMRALTDNGAVLAWCTDRWSPSPVRVAEPTYTDLDAAVAEFGPDLLVLFWATFADERLEALTRTGLPFAVRVHSFDFDPATVERVRSHPLCVGIWAYPHHARLIEGAHELVPLLTERDAFPEPAPERTIVLSASAGLPKKDWPTLVDAFARLARAGVDCRIVVGTTYLHEDEPQLIRQLILESAASIMLSVDVPHDQVIALLGRTAAVVYSKVPDGPFGMPRSIIEGMYAGASVIMPDRAESLLTGGPACRIYRRSEDIVRHVTEVLAGGPAVEAERRANRRFVDHHFADPALATVFTAELSKALAGWKAG